MMCKTGSNYAGVNFYEWLDLFQKKKKKKKDFTQELLAEPHVV